MAHIFLSVPILDKPEFKMVYSMYQAILSCKEHKVRLFVNENDSLIPRVRNVHLSLFLQDYKECDYFVSIDSDLEIVNCYATNNIFSKLVANNKDFVGGLYALKNANAEKPISSSVPLDPKNDRINVPFNSGLMEMRWLSSGCWCLKRDSVEKFVDKHPELNYVGDDNVTGRPINGVYNPEIFEVTDRISGQTFRKYLSEDWSFCERWRNDGGSIYADTSIVLNHIGKIPYSLWNVEVVAHKVDNSAKALQASDLKIQDLKPQQPQQIQQPQPQPKPAKKFDLPDAGFDLIREIQERQG